MSGASHAFEGMALDDFEALLADTPRTERWDHARIVQSIARRLGNQFDAAESPCQAFTETFFTKSRALDAAMLPDVIVVCGDIQPGATSVDTPSVLFEVLSPGTDRISKSTIGWRGVGMAFVCSKVSTASSTFRHFA